MLQRISRQKAAEVILAELEKGSTYSLCLDVIRRKWSLSESTFKRYWKDANEAYQESLQAIKKELESNATQKALEGQNEAILTKSQRMVIASDMARGVISSDSQKPIVPTANDILKALTYLSNIEGDFAPIKQDLTSKGNEIQSARVLTKSEIRDLYKSFDDDY